MITQLKYKIAKILRWSEKYTKTDMLYLTKGGFWVSTGTGIAMLSGLVLSIAFANLLTPEIYGNYRFVISVATIIGAFTLTGMGTAITQAVSRGYEGALRIGFYTHLRWSIGIAVVSFSVAVYYFINENDTLALSMLAVGTLSPFFESFRLHRYFLEGKKEFRINTAYEIFRKLIPLVSMLIALLLTNNVVVLITTYFASQTFTAGILYFLTLKKFTPHTESDTRTINYSKHLSAMKVLSRVASNIDSILVFHFLGAAQVAVYTFAVMLPRQLRNINKILQTLALPQISKRSIPELRESLPRKLMLLLIPITLVVTLYITFAPYIFKTIFPQYMDSVILSQVFALTLFFIPISLLKQVFTAHMQTRQLYITNTVVPIVRIALLLILIPLYGLWGGISALLLSQCLSAIIIMTLFVRLRV